VSSLLGHNLADIPSGIIPRIVALRDIVSNGDVVWMVTTILRILYESCRLG
jgi:hypothetical protein